MNQQPEPVKENKARRDGFAALAAFVLAGALIAMVINHFI
jgi:hypothetical protein